MCDFAWSEHDGQDTHSDAGAGSTGAGGVLDSGSDEKGVPRDYDEVDPVSGVRTVVTHERTADGKLLRTTRKYQLRSRKERVNKDVYRRRQLPKFGDIAGKPKGLEPNVTFVDREEIKLDLSGKREEEKSDVDAMLDKISKMKAMGGKGFLFKQSQKVRQELSSESGAPDTPTASKAPLRSGAPGKFVPAALKGAAGGKSHSDDDLPTIKITNLSDYTTEADLYELCMRFGSLHRCHVAKARYTNETKGFGFVTFTRREDAARAIKALDGYGYDNLILRVEWSKSMAEYRQARSART